MLRILSLGNYSKTIGCQKVDVYRAQIPLENMGRCSAK